VVKCSAVLQYSDDLSNKMSSIIKIHVDSTKLLLICFFHILYVLFFINAYMAVFLFNTVICVFLLLRLCILILCFCIFIVPDGTLQLPYLTIFPFFLLSTKANARVKSAKTGHGPHSSKKFVLFYVLFVLCRSLYCVCVCV